MRKSRTFFAYSTAAAAKQANGTRRAFLAGKISEEEFHRRRGLQEIASHNRIETVMARTWPGYRPQYV